MCMCSHGFDLNQLSTPQLASSSSCQQHGVWSVLRPVPSSVCRTASTTLCIWCQWGSQLVPSVLQSQSVAQPGKKIITDTTVFLFGPGLEMSYVFKMTIFLRIFIINVHHFIWIHSLHMCNAQSGQKGHTEGIHQHLLLSRTDSIFRAATGHSCGAKKWKVCWLSSLSVDCVHILTSFKNCS